MEVEGGMSNGEEVIASRQEVARRSGRRSGVPGMPLKSHLDTSSRP